MWNMVRKGPNCVNGDTLRNNFWEVTDHIINKYKKSSPDGLIQEVAKTFRRKQ